MTYMETGVICLIYIICHLIMDFCYIPGYLSKYVFRKGQFGQLKKNTYIFTEIESIYNLNKKLFTNLIKANLLYEISPKAIFETFKYKNQILNINWFIRSIKYHILEKN